MTVAPPTAPIAVDNHDGTATLTWDPVPGATKYRVRSGARAGVVLTGTSYTTAPLPLGTVVALSVAAGDATSAVTWSRSTPAGPVTLTAPAPLDVPVVKPELVGLLTRTQSRADFRDHACLPDPAGHISGAAVFANWRLVQPEPHGPIVRGPLNPLDAFLADADAHGYHPQVKLRLAMGDNAPDYALTPADSVALLNNDNGATHAIPAWWRPPYRSTFNADGTVLTIGYVEDLQRKLAAIYDTDPRVGQVVVSGACSFNSELLNRQMGSGNGKLLVAAGYTRDADRAALTDDLRIWSDCWQHTQCSVAVNPCQAIQTDPAAQWHDGYGSVQQGGYYIDMDYTYAFLLEALDRLGDRCVWENNGVSGVGGDTSPASRMGALLAFFHDTTLTHPALTVSIQTRQSARLTDPAACLRFCAGYLHATSIELTQDSGTNAAYTDELMAEVAAALQANARTTTVSV